MSIVEDIVKLLSEHTISFVTEDIMQWQIYQLLIRQFECQREVRLSQRDRIDFLVDGGIGIECKVKGSPFNVAGQLLRYAESPQINALILVTSKRSHLTTELFRERVVLGKTLAGVWIAG